jgi:predicted enzyme related to lactoylglutathione lyase
MMSARRVEIGIVVRDLEGSTPFYQDGLGLSHLADVTTPFGLLRRFACGDGVVKLMQLDEQPSKSNPPGGISGKSTGLRWFSVTTDDIHTVLEGCQATGGKVVWPVQELGQGLKVLLVEDPEANCWIEVVEPAAG